MCRQDYDTDNSDHHRRAEPTVYGFYPTKHAGHKNARRRAVAMFLGDALFVASHNGARVVAVSVALAQTVHAGAALATRWLVPSWMLAEMIALHAVRCFEKSWWGGFRGVDGVAFGVVPVGFPQSTVSD